MLGGWWMCEAEGPSGQPRTAIYGRHSTDKRNPNSTDDQLAGCRSSVDRLGGEAVTTYADPEVSGYRRDRQGLRRMLADAAPGKIDIVVCEALDRLARDGEDIAWLGKKLRFHQVRLHTVTEGEIDDIKMAVASMIGTMFLTNLQKKRLRGMEAAVLAGRLAGGEAYGYKRVNRLDARGEIVRGLVEIDPAEAEHVRWMHHAFASGGSSIDLAKDLDTRGVPGPRGGRWNASTIRGNPKALVGIVNNPLYRGRLVWKRREWRKDPDSDKRERRYGLREENEWIRVAVPDLRIVDTATAEAVDQELARRARQRSRTPPPGKPKPSPFVGPHQGRRVRRQLHPCLSRLLRVRRPPGARHMYEHRHGPRGAP